MVTKLGKKPSEVSREDQILENTIRRRIKELSQNRADAFPEEGNLTPADAINRELTKLSHILEEGNAIFTKDEK